MIYQKQAGKTSNCLCGNMLEDHLEIERAWILEKMPPQNLITHNIPHDIGYVFSDKNGELRVVHRVHRKSNGMPNDAHRYSITVKSGGTLTRSEWEDDDFPEWAFELMWRKTDCSINKTRYFVTFGKYRLEIDYYNSRGAHFTGGDVECKDIEGRVRLECEFDSEEEANEFVLPDWAEGAIEITGLEGYRNKNLAANGWPDPDDQERPDWGEHVCKNGSIRPYHAFLCSLAYCWRKHRSEQ